MERQLYEQLFREVLADQKRKFPALPEASLGRSARQLIDMSLASARRSLALARQAPVRQPVRMFDIPSGIPPERAAMLQAFAAESQRHLEAIIAQGDATLRASREHDAREVFADLGITPATLDAVIEAISREQDG